MIRSKGTIRPTALAGVLGAGLLAALLVCGVGICGDVVERPIDLSIPADQLPYKLTSIGSRPSSEPRVIEGDWLAGDADGDGYDEGFWIWTAPSGEGTHATAVVCYPKVSPDSGTIQFNGPFSHGKLWGEPSFLDMNGRLGEELIVTKSVGDSIIMEIINWDTISGPRSSYILAAIGRNLPERGAWHDVHVAPLAAVDLNGDGAKDLIYSRIAKPDSAFERGIVAYDLVHGKQIWFHPMADMVPPENFKLVSGPGGAVWFVFASYSNQNSYSANGMDSEHAYLISLNSDGTERWRRVVGAGGFYPSLVVLDINGDGIEEVCVGTDFRLPEMGGANRIRAFRLLDGEVVALSDALKGIGNTLLVALASRSDSSATIYVTTFSDTIRYVYRLGRNLETVTTVAGTIEVVSTGDVDGDGHVEILAASLGAEVAVLDSNLNLLARALARGKPYTFRGKWIRGIFVKEGPGFNLLLMSRRPLLPLFYARYKWFLSVVVSVILLFLVGRAGLWVSRLYQLSAGVPSLDKIGAMVLVLDRKGKVVYANANELVRLLFGPGLRRRRRYDSTKPPAHPSAVDLIRRSFDQPFNPTQGQFEVMDGNGSRRIELVIYPRIDRRNQVLGKIVVGEDITGRIGWQRKAVLGDAAQRWIHKLKGHLATARIYIDNVLEREASGTEAIRSAGLREDLNAVKTEVEKTTEAAARILRFATIGRPNRIEYDINEVINLAIRPYLDRPPKGVRVVKMLHPGPLLAFVDPNQIGEVLDNLLSNAINAVAAGGVVTVSSRLAEDLQRGKNRGMIEIVVEDDGLGISLDDLPQLFTPGFTKTPGGTGIGLAVVKEIVENHGGEVTVESESGKGSRFVVRIPG